MENKMLNENNQNIIRMLNLVVADNNCEEQITALRDYVVNNASDKHVIFPKVSNIQDGLEILDTFVFMQNKECRLSFLPKLEKILNILFKNYDTNVVENGVVVALFKQSYLDLCNKNEFRLTARICMIKMTSRIEQSYKPHICIGVKSIINNEFIELLHINCNDILGNFTCELNHDFLNTTVYKKEGLYFNSTGCIVYRSNYLNRIGFNNQSYLIKELKGVIDNECSNNELGVLFSLLHLKNNCKEHECITDDNELFLKTLNSPDIKHKVNIYKNKMPKIFHINEMNYDITMLETGIECEVKFTFDFNDKVFLRQLLGKQIASVLVKKVKELRLPNDYLNKLRCSLSNKVISIKLKYLYMRQAIYIEFNSEHNEFLTALFECDLKKLLMSLFKETDYFNHPNRLDNKVFNLFLRNTMMDFFFQNKENHDFNSLIVDLESLFKTNGFLGFMGLDLVQYDNPFLSLDDKLNLLLKLRKTDLLFFSCEINGSIVTLSYKVLENIDEITGSHLICGKDFIFDEDWLSKGLCFRLINPSMMLKNVFKLCSSE